MMNIVFCVNNQYYIQSLISIYSVIESNKDNIDQLQIYILGYQCDISLINKVNAYYNRNIIQYIEVDIKQLIHVYGNKFAYVKILIPQILETIDKCLYLDSDILCLKNLQNLYNINVECLGAVNNINDYNYETALHPYMLNGKKRYHKDYRLYFNTGVLLMNCEYWRQNNIVKKCISQAIKCPDRFCDQDAMNEVLKDIVQEIPLEYNLKTNLWLNDNIQDKLKDINNIDQMMYDPTILHYATRQKPWNDLGYVGPYKYFHDKLIDIIGIQYKLNYLDHDIPKNYIFKDNEIYSRYKNINRIKLKFIEDKNRKEQ